MNMLVCDRQRKLADKRQASSQHLEDDHTDRIEIGGGHRRASLGLLGRNVVGRSDYGSVLREHRLLRRARDPEIGNLHRVVLADEKVLRLYVAMDDADRMSSCNAIEHLTRVANGHAGGERRVSRDDLLERAAGHIFHDDERLPIGYPVVIDHNYVGVVQRGDRRRLASKALHEHRIGGKRGSEQLQRDQATELHVTREKYLGHTTHAEPRIDLVAPGDRSSLPRVLAPPRRIKIIERRATRAPTSGITVVHHRHSTWAQVPRIGARETTNLGVRVPASARREHPAVPA